MTRGIINDMSGKRFGSLVVKERAGSDPQNNALWLCACDCGNVVSVRGIFLKKGQKYCSHTCAEDVRTKDIAGQRFGRLVALQLTGTNDTGGKAEWSFKCDCGNTHIATGDRVRSCITKSCGCLGVESRLTAGGKSLTRAYRSECFMRYSNGKRRATPIKPDARVLRLYEEAQRLSKVTGIPHEVDHVLPLQGRNVSGLHVFENMRVVTRSANRRKSNSFQIDDVC